MKVCSAMIGSAPYAGMSASITVQHVQPVFCSLFADPRALSCCHMRSNSSFTVLGPCLLTFLPTLQELAMDIRWLSLFVLYLDSPSRTMPEIRS